MADKKDKRQPMCTTEESKDVIKVELHIDDLKGSNKEAKNGIVKVTFSKFGFVMDATVKSNGSQTEWHYEVHKLPSEIIENRSSWEIDSGRIVLKLHKKENISWAPLLTKGLDQEPSSDEEKSS